MIPFPPCWTGTSLHGQDPGYYSRPDTRGSRCGGALPRSRLPCFFFWSRFRSRVEGGAEGEGEKGGQGVQRTRVNTECMVQVSVTILLFYLFYIILLPPSERADASFDRSCGGPKGAGRQQRKGGKGGMKAAKKKEKKNKTMARRHNKLTIRSTPIRLANPLRDLDMPHAVLVEKSKTNRQERQETRDKRRKGRHSKRGEW
jgi:hypothetical protein